MSHPTFTQTQFLTLRSQGLSYDKIAKEIHVSKHTLLDWAKEFRPPIDAKFQAALETYHAALTHRAEALARQFQTIAQALSTCDPESSRYPRLASLLLKFHQALQEFDFTPGSLSEDSTKTAPTCDSEPERTKTAPPVEDDRQKLQRINALLRTISAPKSIFSRPIPNKNLPPHLRRIQDRIDRLGAKIGSSTGFLPGGGGLNSGGY